MGALRQVNRCANALRNWLTKEIGLRSTSESSRTDLSPARLRTHRVIHSVVYSDSAPGPRKRLQAPDPNWSLSRRRIDREGPTSKSVVDQAVDIPPRRTCRSLTASDPGVH